MPSRIEVEKLATPYMRLTGMAISAAHLYPIGLTLAEDQDRDRGAALTAVVILKAVSTDLPAFGAFELGFTLLAVGDLLIRRRLPIGLVGDNPLTE